MVKFKVIYKDGTTEILYAISIIKLFVKLVKKGRIVKDIYIMHIGSGKLTKCRCFK